MSVTINVGQIINVYHPIFSGVEMEVIGFIGNIVELDYKGIEYSARLKRMCDGTERFEAFEN